MAQHKLSFTGTPGGGTAIDPCTFTGARTTGATIRSSSGGGIIGAGNLACSTFIDGHIIAAIAIGDESSPRKRLTAKDK